MLNFVSVAASIAELAHGEKSCPQSASSRLFKFHLEQKWGMDVQTRRDISRTVENRD